MNAYTKVFGKLLVNNAHKLYQLNLVINNIHNKPRLSSEEMKQKYYIYGVRKTVSLLEKY